MSPAWGFANLRLDEEARKIGRLAIRSARGILPDGTPFAIPDEHAAPPAIEIAAECKGTLVHLALPLARAGLPEFAIDPGPTAALARFVACDQRVEDNVLGLGEPAEMQLGQLNLRLMLDEEPRSGFCSLAVARVVERAWHRAGQSSTTASSRRPSSAAGSRACRSSSSKRATSFAIAPTCSPHAWTPPGARTSARSATSSCSRWRTASTPGSRISPSAKACTPRRCSRRSRRRRASSRHSASDAIAARASRCLIATTTSAAASSL